MQQSARLSLTKVLRKPVERVHIIINSRHISFITGTTALSTLCIEYHQSMKKDKSKNSNFQGERIKITNSLLHNDLVTYRAKISGIVSLYSIKAYDF
jgi:hypothetical protein